MKTIAFDEAGYTGQDLINKEQPVFSLSSVNMSDDETQELLSLISTNADEIKFNKLKKYAKFEKELEKVLNHKIISNKTVMVTIAHKEYMIIAQTVDKLIEPLAYKESIDIYQEGMNLGLTNLLYYCLPVYCDKNLIDLYSKAFVKLFRDKQKNDIVNFYQVTEKLYNSCIQNEIKLILGAILHSSVMIEDLLEYVDKFTLDVSATSVMILSDYWGKIIKDSFNILADNSKPLEHYKWIFERLKSNKLTKREVGYGSRKIVLPLKINEFNLVDSKQFIQIQIADLIAGASAYYGKSLTKYGQKDSLSEMIGNSKIEHLFLRPIWPHDAITPEQLKMDKTGNNILDEFSKIIYDND